MTIAAAFHDLGIWTAGTFDYIEPSIAIARAHLAGPGRHELDLRGGRDDPQPPQGLRLRGPGARLVETFRRADWIDVTWGLRSFGLPRRICATSLRRFPDAGFHGRLVRLAIGRARSHPLAPLPMVRL